MEWIKISIATTKCAEEIISDVLISAGAQGVNIEGDEESCAKEMQPWDYIDEDFKSDKPYSISAYFACDGTQKEVMQTIKNRLQELTVSDLQPDLGSLQVTQEVVDEKNWESAWKEHFKPSRISNYVVIKPTWEEYVAEKDDLVIELDPGMAFGTGSHETTKLCVNLMEEYVEERMSVVDVGCGSGILSIAAVLLGAKDVVALDFDGVAVEVTKENVEKNGCSGSITVKKSDLLSALEKGYKADMIVANIIADVVLLLANTVTDSLKKNGMLICSGIIDTRLEEVKTALLDKGFRIIKIMQDGQWRAVAAKYKG